MISNYHSLNDSMAMANMHDAHVDFSNMDDVVSCAFSMLHFNAHLKQVFLSFSLIET